MHFKSQLIGFWRSVLGKACIQRLSAAKSRLDRMPVIDTGFAHLPAQQNNFAIHHARKIEQPCFQVFYLNANRIDLGNSIFRLLHLLFDLSPLPHHGNDIHLHAAGEKDTLSQTLQMRLLLFGGFLALDRTLQQRFEYRQQ